MIISTIMTTLLRRKRSTLGLNNNYILGIALFVSGWRIVHMFMLLKQFNPENQLGILKASRGRETASLEFLWEDEEDDGDYSEPYRSSPESFKVRQSRRGLIPQTDSVSYQPMNNLLESTTPSNISINTGESMKLLRLGRKGYNTTILSLCQYDYKRYREESSKLSWEIRLNLLRDFQACHGHLFVPYRYTAMVNDYHVNGTMMNPYPIHLGRWLYHIRRMYKDKPHTLTKKMVDELKDLGMDLKGVGVGRRPGSFQSHLNMLKDFREQYGHCRVPRVYPENRSLGLWVERQRCLFRRKCLGQTSSLTDIRLMQLMDLGFDFGVKVDLNSQDPIDYLEVFTKNRRTYGKHGDIHNVFERIWKRHFEQLKLYIQYYGHSNVPLNYNVDVLLGLWVAEQRREFSLLFNDASPERKTGLSSLMTVTRFRMLSEIGFNFTLNPSIEQTIPCPWRDIGKQHFDFDLVLASWASLLQRDKAKCNDIDYCISQNSRRVSTMYSVLRRLRWEKSYSLTPEQAASQSIQTTWLYRNESLIQNLGGIAHLLDHDRKDGSHLEKEFDWWDNFFDLVRYKRHHGVFDVRQGELWYSERLLKWLQLQRDSYDIMRTSGIKDDDTSILSERHFQALIDVGFPFRADENIPGLLTLGRKPVVLRSESTGYKDISQSRRLREGRSGRMSPVESIGLKLESGVNDLEEWNLMVSSLKAFQRKYKHCFVPPLWHDKKFGRWVHTVRRASVQKHSSVLTATQLNELKDMGIDLQVDDYTWAVISFEEMFNARLLELREFKDLHGHCNVPLNFTSPYFELSLWVKEQRTLFQRLSEGQATMLDSSKIQLLEDLDFSWK